MGKITFRNRFKYTLYSLLTNFFLWKIISILYGLILVSYLIVSPGLTWVTFAMWIGGGIAGLFLLMIKGYINEDSAVTERNPLLVFFAVLLGRVESNFVGLFVGLLILIFLGLMGPFILLLANVLKSRL